MQKAPLLLFTYKRLETLRNTVEALKKNVFAEESELFIFSDAARYVDDQALVAEVRKYLRTITGFKAIHIIESQDNKGLARSIIEGVSSILSRFEAVIVLEDDLGTTPNFLAFMNNCLNKYKDSKAVFSVSGYSFNLGRQTNCDKDAYLINRGWSWGWATWKDRWEQVDWEVQDYSRFILDKRARAEFAKGGSDLNSMLDKQMAGKLDSWAIRWFYHQFRTSGLTVYPVYSKVFNNGFDQFATHTNGSDRRYLPLLDVEHKFKFNLPDDITIHSDYQRAFIKKMNISARIISKMETIVKKIFG